MATLLFRVLFVCAFVQAVKSGNDQYTWERDPQHEQNRLTEDDPLVDEKQENPKDFLGALYRRIFGKSESQDQPRVRHGRQAIAVMAATTRKTTKKPTTTPRTTRKTTTKTTVTTRTTTPAGRRTTTPRSSASVPNTSISATLVFAMAALCFRRLQF